MAHHAVQKIANNFHLQARHEPICLVRRLSLNRSIYFSVSSFSVLVVVVGQAVLTVVAHLVAETSYRISPTHDFIVALTSARLVEGFNDGVCRIAHAAFLADCGAGNKARTEVFMYRATRFCAAIAKSPPQRSPWITLVSKARVKFHSRARPAMLSPRSSIRVLIFRVAGAIFLLSRSVLIGGLFTNGRKYPGDCRQQSHDRCLFRSKSRKRSRRHA